MDDLFKLFEGICPNCDNEITITEVGGVAAFHNDYTFSEGEVVVWEAGEAFGGLTFDCDTCGAQFYVENTGPECGCDWVM